MEEKQELECTVLMSSYNGHVYIRQQLDSILHQEGVRINLQIRDDGSSDETSTILDEYKKLYGDQICIYYGENVGIHKSFAELMTKPIKGDFVAFADQDDVWDSNKIITAINQLCSNNADFYSCASRLVDGNLNDLGYTTSNSALYHHYMKGHNIILTPGAQGCTMVLKRELFEMIVNKGIPDYYGHDTWLTVVSYYLRNSIYDEKPHMSYRQHNKSWTGNRGNRIKQFFREYRFFIKGMARYSILAKDFLARYSDELNSDEQSFLSLLSKSPKSLQERLYLIRDSSFRKFGFLNNVLFKFEILKGNV